MRTSIDPPSIAELPALGRVAVTLGVFDGVHAGHRRLLQATVAAADRVGGRPLALVFHPHPDEVLRPGSRVRRLAPPAANLARIQDAGVHPQPMRFDDALRGLTPEEFLDGLGESMELRALVMTPETAFGRGRAGTLDRMRQLSVGRGYEVVSVDPLLEGGQPVSSSRIRSALADGDLELATALLGHAPGLSGTVVEGDHRGRALGFPTANLAFDYAAALPPLGIYVGRSAAPTRGVVAGHPSLVSIGVRPTFHDDGRVLVEVYLLDWDGDLYGETLSVELLEHLRDEHRFDSVEELVAQMQRDEEVARDRLGMPAHRP